MHCNPVDLNTLCKKSLPFTINQHLLTPKNPPKILPPSSIMLSPISSTRAASRVLRRGIAASFRANKSTLSVGIRGNGTGLAQSVTTADPYTINMDTYKPLGGNETAPSPLSYSLASLSGCNQITGELVARDLGIKTGKWEVEVKGAIDADVLVKGTEGHGNWDSVEVIIKVETNLGDGEADREKFALFRSETERRCPLSQLYIRSGLGWKNEWKNVSTAL